jgi:hypothetical protein
MHNLAPDRLSGSGTILPRTAQAEVIAAVAVSLCTANTGS